MATAFRSIWRPALGASVATQENRSARGNCDETGDSRAQLNIAPGRSLRRLAPSCFALATALSAPLATSVAHADSYLIGAGGTGAAAANPGGNGVGGDGGGGGIGGGGAGGTWPHGGGAGGGVEVGGSVDAAGYGASNAGPDGGLGGYVGGSSAGGGAGVGGGGGGGPHALGTDAGGGGAGLGGGGGASPGGIAGADGGVLRDIFGGTISAIAPSQGAPVASGASTGSPRTFDYAGVGGGGGGASDGAAGGNGGAGSLGFSTARITVNRSMLIGGGGGGGSFNYAGGRGGDGFVNLTFGAELAVAEHLLIGGSNGGGGQAMMTGGRGGAGTLSVSDARVLIGDGGRLRLGGGQAGGGSGNLLLGPGTLQFGAGATFVINDNGVLRFGGMRGSNVRAGSISGLTTLQNDGSIEFNQLGTAVLNAGVTGIGSVITSSGATYLTGENTYTGGTTVAAGSTLNIGANGTSGSLTGAVVVNGALVFSRSDASAFGGSLDGGGQVEKAGAGTLTINGSHLFTGNILASGGTLNFEGSAPNANFVVDSGAVLGGTGRLGTVNIASGGEHAPGNPLGTQTVSGAYKNSGTLRITATPAANASLTAMSTVELDNTTLALALSPNDAASWAPSATPVVIVDKQSAGAITGGVGRIVNPLLFLDADVSTTGGDGNDLTIRLIPKITVDPGTGMDPGTGAEPGTNPEPGANPEPGRPNFAAYAGTANQRAVANAAQRLPQSSEVWRALALSTDAGDYRQALDALSGDMHASVNSALLSTGPAAMRRGLDSVRGNLSAAMLPGAATASAGASDAPPAAGVLPRTAAQPIWVQVEGDWRRLNSDGNGPALTQQTTTLALGGDMEVGRGWRLGTAFGYADSKLKADSRAATSDTQSYTAALYGGKAFELGAGALNVLGGTAYSWHDIDTRRQIGYGSLAQNLTADYSASTTQLFAEVGYALPVTPNITIEPFAGLSWNNLRTRGFSESGGSAALSAKRQSQTLTSTLAGLRARWLVPDSAIALRGLLGWRHAYGNVQPGTSLAFDNGNSFSVAGTPIARDAARVEFGADLVAIRDLTIGVSYAGEFGGGNRQHSGMLDMRWRY
ncbi:autotransporter domain-containing protein [Achromobacter seleniivolatilans]|uniref:Autotransporter domain-containing protein n=1 Tax=Achromobacter seleniivolatilans TaxID=3047478 RepID=A0ABY9M2H7_9BURK|nr:autotransporter outer membrane beta-barrel domain-containing protein [Achromobacter sp. R39]WMD20892.1 autotransporter domain-containing protein [Achromobacter sp. R39]